MTTSVQHSPRLTAMVAAIDNAVASRDPRTLCSGVKRALIAAVEGGDDLLPTEHSEPTSGGYARRLVHKDPAGGYSVVAMVWDVGQGTPIHDHAGKWCVECCYRGEILVTSYGISGDPAVGPVRFQMTNEVVSGRCDAGILIPPVEYHKIEQHGDGRACTIHVYAGEMNWCHAFHPIGDGTYQREYRQLSYSN